MRTTTPPVDSALDLTEVAPDEYAVRAIQVAPRRSFTPPSMQALSADAYSVSLGLARNTETLLALGSSFRRVLSVAAMQTGDTVRPGAR